MESVQFGNWLPALRASVNIPAGTSQTLTTGTSPHSTTPAAMECVQPDNRLGATLPSVNHPAGTTQTLDTNVLPHSTTPAAMENLQPSNRLAATLASLARAEAEAEAEAEARQPRTKAKQYEAVISKNSEWMPEYLVPLLPPPSNNAANDAANNEHVLRVFWNHVRTHSQHWAGMLDDLQDNHVHLGSQYNSLQWLQQRPNQEVQSTLSKRLADTWVRGSVAAQLGVLPKTRSSSTPC